MERGSMGEAKAELLAGGEEVAFVAARRGFSLLTHSKQPATTNGKLLMSLPAV
jgi:hypothetical protein